MVCVRIDVIDADRVDAELLHEGGIELALGRVDERVVWKPGG